MHSPRLPAAMAAGLALAPVAGWELRLSGDYTRFEDGDQLRTLLGATPAASGITATSDLADDDLYDYIDPLPLRVMANRAGSTDTRGTISVQSCRAWTGCASAVRWGLSMPDTPRWTRCF